MRIADQGQFTVNTTLERLTPLITSAEFMAQALPDVFDAVVGSMQAALGKATA